PAQMLADELADDKELNRRERREARLEHISVAYAATALGLTRVPTFDIPSRRRVFLSETQLDQTPQEPHSSVPATSPNVPTLAAAAETLTAAAGLPAAVPKQPALALAIEPTPVEARKPPTTAVELQAAVPENQPGGQAEVTRRDPYNEAHREAALPIEYHPDDESTNTASTTRLRVTPP